MKSSEFKRRMAYNIILLVSLSITIASVSFAWFYSGTDMEVRSVQVGVLSGQEIMISNDQETWGSAITDIKIDDIDFSPIVGNGTKFFKPVYEYQNLAPEEETYTEFYGYKLTGYSQLSSEEYSQYFYQDSFYIRTNYSGNLFLGSETLIEPLDTSARIVSGLNASADYIVGALRVCFELKVGSSYVTKLIWIPKPNYQLSDTTFNANGNDENQYTFVYDRYLSSTKYVTVAGLDSNNLKTSSGVNYLIGDFVSDFQLGTFSANVPVEVRITVWLDGTDRECKESLSGGKFKLDVAFKGA